MAHRTSFSNDLFLPKQIQQYRVTLQKQIQKLRQRQKMLIQQNDQKLKVMEKRLIYGKKKIFAFDKQINRMTLGDQIFHYNLEIKKLNEEIANEQKVVKEKNEEKDMKLGEYAGRESVINNIETGNKQTGTNKKERVVINTLTDPHQQLMSLTHQIMRLKKSLQQVRSKYSDNFTEYKLKQQYQKLKDENQQIAAQLRQLEAIKKKVDQKISASNMSDVDYDQLEIIRAKKEYECVERERNLLKEYLGQLQNEQQQRQESDERKVQEFREEKIMRLKKEIDQVTKQNQILGSEIQLTNKEIQRCYQYQQKLMGKVSST